MKVEKVNPVDDKWEAFVRNHPDGSVFHSASWAKLLVKTYGYIPSYFCIVNALGEMVAGIPVFLLKSIFTGARMISVPFADYCDPLFDHPQQIELLLGTSLQRARELDLDYVEFRAKNRIDDFRTQSMVLLQKEDDYAVHILEVPRDLNEIRKKFESSQVERNIKKGLKSTLEVSLAGGEKDLRAFYDLEVLTRKRKGLPPHPYRFFKNMWELFSPENTIHILIARDGSQPVSAVVLVHYKDTMHYLYGGSNRDHLGKRPNHLLIWKGIEMTHDLNLSFFDFGRTGRDNAGLMAFKKSWGAKEMAVSHFTYAKRKKPRLLLNRTRSHRDFAHKTTAMLPSKLLKVMGAVIYRHLG